MLPEDAGSMFEFLNLIRVSNDDLPVDSGHVAKVSEPKKGFRDAMIILNEEPFMVWVKYTIRSIWPKK